MKCRFKDHLNCLYFIEPFDVSYIEDITEDGEMWCVIVVVGNIKYKMMYDSYQSAEKYRNALVTQVLACNSGILVYED